MSATPGRAAGSKDPAYVRGSYVRGSGTRKVIAIVVKEMRQIGRDRRTLLILLFVPAFFLLIYGYALSFDIRHIRLAVDDRDRSVQSRDLISAFVNSGFFDLVASVDGPHDLVGLIDRNDARAALVIPTGFGRDAVTGRRTSVQVIINGDNANTATTVMGYALNIVATISSRYEVQGRLGTPSGPLLTLEPRVWYNPELRSVLYLVPGLIAYIAMLTAVVSTALSVVREKEMGTMEQVRMSPVGPLAYVAGKTVPYFFISLASSMGIVAMAMLLFDLPMRGSWAMLFVAVSLFLVGALAFGLLISTLAETQQVAFQVALLTSYLPTLMLSGFIFPISSMPTALQVVTYVVPARYFLVALRAIVLKGVGIEVFWRDLLALVVYTTVIVALATLRLKREWA
jgi:ABC-2 type transport system permease protein